jgi:hypothetical protein
LKKPSLHRRATTLLCLLIPCIIGITSIFVLKIQVLAIGDAGYCFRVKNGDTIALSYTHSMYKVPVIERFKVENGMLELFHVETSDAALEYFGIEGKGINNVRTSVKEFTIPTVSVGHHLLSVSGKNILLGSIKTKDQKIQISLNKQSFASYLINSIWRR